MEEYFIDIITSIFYDKITRMSNSSIAKEIIHVRRNKGSAKLLLSIGGTVYEINKAILEQRSLEKSRSKQAFLKSMRRVVVVLN